MLAFGFFSCALETKMRKSPAQILPCTGVRFAGYRFGYLPIKSQEKQRAAKAALGLRSRSLPCPIE